MLQGHTRSGIFPADGTVDVGILLSRLVQERIGAEARSNFKGHIPGRVVEIT